METLIEKIFRQINFSVISLDSRTMCSFSSWKYFVKSIYSFMFYNYNEIIFMEFSGLKPCVRSKNDVLYSLHSENQFNEFFREIILNQIFNLTNFFVVTVSREHYAPFLLFWYNTYSNLYLDASWTPKMKVKPAVQESKYQQTLKPECKYWHSVGIFLFRHQWSVNKPSTHF